MTKKIRTIGVLGGTFNPIHNGHLRIAVECFESLALDELRMIVSARPPHRDEPDVAPLMRYEMLKRALAHVTTNIIPDDREIKRSGQSYMVDTLSSLKNEFPDDRLCLIMGSDAFQSLDSWYKWQSLLDYAHIVIAQRPDYDEDLRSDVGYQLKSKFVDSVDDLKRQKRGAILAIKVSQLEISSTAIRQLFFCGNSPQYLLPDSVIEYIRQQNLYQ